jgi:hypothetical protein
MDVMDCMMWSAYRRIWQVEKSMTVILVEAELESKDVHELQYAPFRPTVSSAEQPGRAACSFHAFNPRCMSISILELFRGYANVCFPEFLRCLTPFLRRIGVFRVKLARLRGSAGLSALPSVPLPPCML